MHQADMPDRAGESTATLLLSELAFAKSFLIESALPFWSTHGFDAKRCLFEERCDFEGRPINDIPQRLMVQCRQIYVFAHATWLGWFDGRELVRKALAALLANYKGRHETAPYVFSIARDGAIIEARQDAYGYAFVLLALSWARRVLGDEVKKDFAENLLRHFDEALAHPQGRGYLSELPRTDLYLRQNPQMHLFEAALEVEGAFGLKRATLIADRLYRLFGEDMFLTDERALPELHDENWRPPQQTETFFEPGHHFEWIWLLDRYAMRSGVRADDLIAQLADRAYAEGVDAQGAVIERVTVHSRRRTQSRRSWGTCEGLKAAASDFERGRDPALAMRRAASFLHALRVLFVGKPFAAGWIDTVDAAGAPMVDYVPASTLYHLMQAVAEADRIFSPGLGRDG